MKSKTRYMQVYVLRVIYFLQRLLLSTTFLKNKCLFFLIKSNAFIHHTIDHNLISLFIILQLVLTG
jgi:hypothetical protein